MEHRRADKKINFGEIRAVDLFCGIGGLSRGFVNQGIRVVAGIDNDPACRYGYEHNNKADFLEMDISKLSAKRLKELYGNDAQIRVLMGCAPCQPFSGLNPGEVPNEDLLPLRKFAFLIKALKPEIVSMENVRGLAEEGKYPVFKSFLSTLKRNGYHYSYQIVNAADYGVPQKRHRLVLLASRLGTISLIPPTHKGRHRTVRYAIADLPAINDGETDARDPVHRAAKLSPLNKRRILATKKNGGNSEDWPKELVLKCHKKKTGLTYKSTVYGRMRWDEPAPTMTTHCNGLGNGRFGHPRQNRAISLREAALIQSFPKDYQFYNPKDNFSSGELARVIGNAVPVLLGEAIAKSVKRHLRDLRSVRS